MKNKTSKVYKDYPEQPYISNDRDVKLWEDSPELFHYGIIQKQQMIRLDEGILPGHIIMLWRINFDNITNETIFPQYFEYRYGVDVQEVLETLINKQYIAIASATDTLKLLNMTTLKKILKHHNLQTSGKKETLMIRVIENINDTQLSKLFSLRKYSITDLGKKILHKYDSVVIKHGPKM